MKVDIFADGNTVGERSIMAVCDLRSVIVVPHKLGVAGFLPSFQSSPSVPRVLCADEALPLPLADDMCGCRHCRGLREKLREIATK